MEKAQNKKMPRGKIGRGVGVHTSLMLGREPITVAQKISFGCWSVWLYGTWIGNDVGVSQKKWFSRLALTWSSG
jgi:hypothetical protein